MSKIFTFAILLHLPFLLARADSADIQVILDNGDRLSGELIWENDSELRLLVDYLGEVSIPLIRVSEQTRTLREQAESELDVPADEPQNREMSVVLSETQQEVIEEEMTTAEAIAAEEQTDSEPQQGFFSGFLATLGDLEEGLNPLPEWDKRLQFGITSTSGRKDQTSLNYLLDMQRKFEASRMNFKAEYSFAEADGVATRDRVNTDLRWRKDISPGVFYESRSIYFSDAIKLINSNIEQKLGLGTRFVDNDISTLSAGLGASGRWRDQVGNSDQDVAYLVDLFQDWDYRMTEKISLKQDFKIAMPLEETEGYEVNFSAAVTSAVTDSLNFSIRYELGYDNSLDKDLKEDRRFISSLGYAF